MILNRRVDLQRQLQGFAAVVEGYCWYRTRANGMQKRLNLRSQRLARFDFGLIEGNAGRAAQSHRRRFATEQSSGGVLIDADTDDILPPVIDRDVLMRLEETQLANIFCAHSACGEVRNTP